MPALNPAYERFAALFAICCKEGSPIPDGLFYGFFKLTRIEQYALAALELL